MKTLSLSFILAVGNLPHVLTQQAVQAPVPTLRVSAVAYVGMTKTETYGRRSIGGQVFGKDAQKQNTVTLLVSVTNLSKFPAQNVLVEYQYHKRLEDYKAGTKEYAVDRGVRQREWSTTIADQGSIPIRSIPAGATVRLTCPAATFRWGTHSDQFSNSWGNWETGALFSHYVIKVYCRGQVLGTHQGNNRTHIRPAER